MGEPSGGVSRRQFLVGGAVFVAAGVGAAVAVAAGLAGGRRDHDRDPTRPGLPGRHEPPGDSWGELISLGTVAPVHASLLPSGYVLMAGVGDSAQSPFPNFVVDPDLPGPIRVDPMDVPMRSEKDSLFCAGHSYLADGRMLQVGGQRIPIEAGLDYSLLFDSWGVRWTAVRGSILGGPSWYPTVTRLSDARMLVISGFTDFGTEENRTVQLFDPFRYDHGQKPWSLLVPHDKSPNFSPTGADYSHVFQLPRPVMVDGQTRQVVLFGRSGRIYFLDHADSHKDPAARLATRPNAQRPGRTTTVGSAAGASSVILADGRILIVGGGQEGGDFALSEAHIYDPYRDTWKTVDTGTARSHPVAVLLPDGTVLIVNGDGDAPDELRKPQILDPVSETVFTGPPWPDDKPRGYHNVALLLPDGRVLTAGGERAGEESERADVRYYFPPYLSVLAERERPSIVGAPQEMRYGQSYTLRFRRGPLHRVAVLALGSMTHSFDQNQRCVVLFDGEASSQEITLTGPKDPFIAPPGYYMLFLQRRVYAGGDPILVPSVARIIRVG
jgi:Domain of unknown function (DUF1929)